VVDGLGCVGKKTALLQAPTHNPMLQLAKELFCVSAIFIFFVFMQQKFFSHSVICFVFLQ